MLSFSVEGLSAREELLFKSFVRLLNHRTRHAWLYTARPMQFQADFKVDLRVVPDETDHGLIPPEQCLLTLGTLHHIRNAYLRLPLRPEELEVALNRQGDQIISSRAAGVPPFDAAPAAPQPARQAQQAQPVEAVQPMHPLQPVVAETAPADAGEAMRLLRWPPASLLRSAGHMRMATIMTGQRLTLAALQQRSGQPAPVCAAFVDDLRRAGCLETLPTTTPALRMTEKMNPAPKALPGLLARIRSRFGFQTGGPA